MVEISTLYEVSSYVHTRRVLLHQISANIADELGEGDSEEDKIDENPEDSRIRYLRKLHSSFFMAFTFCGILMEG